jgi:hypothetical protein
MKAPLSEPNATQMAEKERRKQLVANVARWAIIAAYVVGFMWVDPRYQPRVIGIVSVVALLLMACGVLRFKKAISRPPSAPK